MGTSSPECTRQLDLSASAVPGPNAGTATMPNRERDIFEACLEIASETGREAFLHHACAGDAELAERVRRLLSAHARAEVLPSREEPRAPLEARMPDRIGPYRILEKIGQGGMGVVYLGELSQPIRRQVAIKVLRETAGSSEVLARFEAERQALAMMAHPCIARIVYADVTERGQPYFVMDYVRGLPITEYCDTRRIDVEGRLRLFQQVCSGVRHAHQKGIIHRDLKPSNILVTDEPGVATPKIIDFGVAKATHLRLTELTLHTRMGQAVGTPEYMSPEQADGAALEVDTRSDVYSLGVVLYELICGERPIGFGEHLSFADVQRALREQTPRPPSVTVLLGVSAEVAERRGVSSAELVTALRGDLDAVVLKALAKEPGRRYDSVDRLSEDVQRMLDRRPVTARPDTFTYRASRFVRRNRPTVVAAALVIASLVGGVFASSWQARQARRQAEIADAARDEARAALGESREISDFLVSLFRLTDADADREAREAMLRRGVIEAEAYTGRPRVQALILTALARAHTASSEPEEGTRLAARALRTIRGAEPDGSATEARVLLALGLALWAVQQHDSAAAVIGQARELARRHLGPTDPELADVYSMAGTVARTAGRFDEAEAFYASAAEALGRTDPDHPGIARMLMSAAYTKRLAGDFEGAEPAYLEALDFTARVRGEDHVETVAARLDLADFLSEEGIDLQRAETLYREAVADVERALGPEALDLARPLDGLGFLLASKGEFEEAEGLMRRSLRISEAVRGTNNLGTARERELLSRLLFQAGRAEEGYSTVDEVLRVKLDVGATVPAVVSLWEVGRIAISLGDFDRAEAYAAQLAELVEGLGEASRYASEAPALWGVLFAARGEYERAEQELLSALRLAERRPDVPRSIRARLFELAGLYDAWGRVAEAEAIRARLAEVESTAAGGGSN